ncbi:hypothetical protein KSP40_PGU018936 [Platanthera guangdongensis]|uniref:Peptidase S54 rhomboid domain-containing protein n=1 Tax=Platanthera guangdongensis TaxID=2320717 RepID=A0ABR2LG65_9ASPA
MTCRSRYNLGEREEDYSSPRATGCVAGALWVLEFEWWHWWLVVARGGSRWLEDVLRDESDRALKNIGYANVGLSYEAAIEGKQYWRIITSAFSHISVLHLIFNMSALWSLGVVEQLGGVGLGIEFYLQYTLVLLILSGLLVLGVYHVLVQRFKLDYFRKFAPFESLIFTSIIVPKASFIGHLSGIIVGYCIAWDLIHGMNSYWTVVLLGWIALVFVLSLKRSGTFNFSFIKIEDVTDLTLPTISFVTANNRRIQMEPFSNRLDERV